MIKKSIEHAKQQQLLTDHVMVSKQFFKAACDVSELMTSAPSLTYQRQHLPKALNQLEKEVKQHHQAEFANAEPSNNCVIEG